MIIGLPEGELVLKVTDSANLVVTPFPVKILPGVFLTLDKHVSVDYAEHIRLMN